MVDGVHGRRGGLRVLGGAASALSPSRLRPEGQHSGGGRENHGGLADTVVGWGSIWRAPTSSVSVPPFPTWPRRHSSTLESSISPLPPFLSHHYRLFRPVWRPPSRRRRRHRPPWHCHLHRFARLLACSFCWESSTSRLRISRNSSSLSAWRCLETTRRQVVRGLRGNEVANTPNVARLLAELLRGS